MMMMPHGPGYMILQKYASIFQASNDRDECEFKERLESGNLEQNVSSYVHLIVRSAGHSAMLLIIRYFIFFRIHYEIVILGTLCISNHDTERPKDARQIFDSKTSWLAGRKQSG